MGAKEAKLRSTLPLRSSRSATPRPASASPPTREAGSGLRTRTASVPVLCLIVEAVVEAVAAVVPHLEGAHAHVGVDHHAPAVLLCLGPALEVHVETAVVEVEEVDAARADLGLRGDADVAWDEEQRVADADLHLQRRVPLRQLHVAQVDHELAGPDAVVVAQVGRRRGLVLPLAHAAVQVDVGGRYE